MTEQRRVRLWDLFDQAADLPPPEQRALLDAACPDDPDLRAAVEKLLADDARVRELRREHGALRMRLLAPEHAGEINARLVGAGVSVTRLEPVRQTLEERFLEMTTRLEVAA